MNDLDDGYDYDTAKEATYWVVTVNRGNGRTISTGPHPFAEASDMFMRHNDAAVAILMVEVVK